MMISSKNILLFFFISILSFSCQNQTEYIRPTIDLSGEWQFSIDTNNVGIQQNWYTTDLQDIIKLPGTTDSNQKGFINTDTTTLHLNRLYFYEGPAWYRKKINISPNFSNKHIELIMERTKSSMVWIDENYIGESYILQSPQHYDVTKYLTPGEHTITIRIDNNLELTPYGNVHIYTDETQTNWNGIIGSIIIEASPKTHISDLQVFPDIENKKVQVNILLTNGLNLPEIDIELKVESIFNNNIKQLKSVKKTIPCDSLIKIDYILGNDMMLWDDYQQPLYKFTASIRNDSVSDSKSVSFGMREFGVKDKQFTINNRTTFLRGKHDACVFPLTGHPPMDKDGWLKVFKIAQSYGINHYRFHSYCPPKAAFEAADQVGIFLQPELPFWGGLDDDSVAARLRDEGIAMLKHYANHPSFVMFGAGNEIWAGHERVNKIINELKEKDKRPLYTTGANNNIGYVWPSEFSDFHIAARIPFEKDTTLTHLRLTHAFVDSRDGGILNTVTPSAMVNFEYSVEQISVPLISHEIGQYQIYPDYDEIKKYTGVVSAWNLEVFRNRLKQKGMIEQNKDFQKASGAWSAICYKAEMEAALRTKRLAGFQLLDLQDFPGQGTALVGILDAFMESKNVISREGWLQSCNDVVLLLEFPKYTWETNEYYKAKIRVANYSNRTIIDDVLWRITNQQGKVHAEGTIPKVQITNGELIDVGEITTTFSKIKSAMKLTIDIHLKKNEHKNSYPIWVYPAAKTKIQTDGIIITDNLNNKIISELEKGNKVLLFPTAESVKEKSVAGLFPPDFWN